jgi:pimeloyl-ACP methyl ester carboxylesterase
MNHQPFLRSWHLFTLLLLFASFTSNAQVQTARYARIAGNSNGYYEYLPPDYNTSGQNYPLLIFVHGIGELGDGSQYQLPKVLVNGPPRLINNGSWPVSFKVKGRSYSFIVISPQFTYWPGGNDIKSVIDYCVSHYRVDQSRIYVTGLSMGGGVVWDYASMSTEAAMRVAAIVPVCGALDGNLTRGKIIAGANLPVWALQNQNDPTVSSQNTVDWYNAINAPSAPVANPPMVMTLFPASGHDAWTRAYDPNYKEKGMNVYEWMLQYSRNGSYTPVSNHNYTPVVNAGTDQNITLPNNSVSLNGSATSANGSIASYNWTQVSGPNTAAIANAWSAQTSVSNLVAGTYTFQLTAKDNAGITNTATVTITVNAAPTYVSIPGVVQAESYTSMNSVKTENTADGGGGQDVGYINSGSWMDYAVNVPSSGTYTVSFRVASVVGNASLSLKKSDGTVLSTVNLPNTGGYQSWQTVSTTVNLTAGQQMLRVYSNSTNWNINWLQFANNVTTTPTPAPVTTGTSGAASNGTTIHIEAENYTTMNSVQKETTSDVGGGQDVGYISQGSWLAYSISPSASGTYTVSFRVATIANSAHFQLKNASGVVLATVNLPNTGGWQKWKTVTAKVNLTAGQQTLSIYSTSNQWNQWNLNWLEFAPGGNTAASSNTPSSKNTGTLALSVSPAVTSGNFLLQVNNNLTGTMNVQILDGSGTVDRNYPLTKDAQGTTQNYLSIADLAKGTYTVTVIMGSWSQAVTITRK